MKRKAFVGLSAILLCLGAEFSTTVMAQPQCQMTAKPAQDPSKIWLRSGPYKILDTPEIVKQMDIARRLAGDSHSLLTLQRLQCRDIDDTYTIVQTPGANVISADPQSSGWHEAPAVPTKVFDNVYYVGGMEVGGWLIDTGDGYIMLDSSYDYGYEEVLLPNMAKLGLDPAQVKYILITHAGPDHIGAAGHFQKDYGTKIIFDSNLRNIPTTVMKDGDTLTVGDTTITMVQTPRTVGGGGLSYLIPVKINGKSHMWATFGNTGLGSTLADKAVYRQSMEKFITYVDKLKADVAISSHPFVDASLDRMKAIRECDTPRSHRHDLCGHRNPFLIGEAAARRYFEIMDQCAVVQIQRQEAGLDATGLMRLP